MKINNSIGDAMGYLFILFTIILFSTLEVTGKLIGADISPFAITLYRFLLGGVFMLPFAFKQQKGSDIKLTRGVIFKLSVPGFINVSISMLFLQLAIYYGEANISAILISANSVFVAIFSYLILKEKLSIYKIMGLLIGLIGIIIIIMNHHPSSRTVINAPLGVLFACIASVSFGFYTVISKKYIKEYGNVVTNAISFLGGSLLLAIISLIAGFDISMDLTSKNIIFISYLGIFVSGIAYLTYFAGLKKIATVVGSSFFFLKPAIASILAYLIFRETLTSWQIVGIVVVIIGVNLEVFRDIINKKKPNNQRLKG